MTLPRRQIWVLRSFAFLGLLFILSGLWEYRLSGAVHQLICGTLILLLVFWARRRWARAEG